MKKASGESTVPVDDATPQKQKIMAVRLGLRAKLLLALFGASLLTIVLAGLAGWQMLDKLRNRMGDDYLRASSGLNAELTQEMIGSQLSMSLQMAQSNKIKAWLADENNSKLRADALAKAEEYRNNFRDHSWFMAPTGSGNFYYNDDRHPVSGEPRYRLTPDDRDAQWSYRTQRQRSGYTINVQENPYIDTIKIWLNVTVRQADGKPLGVVGTGIELGRFLDEFASRREQGLTPIVIDNEGFIRIHMDRSLIAFDSAVNEGDEMRPTLFNLLGSRQDIATARRAMNRARNNPGNAELFSVQLEGHQQRVAVVWLSELQWHVLTAIDLDASRILTRSDVLGLALPVLGMALVAALLFLFAVNRLVNRRLLMLGTAAAESFADGRINSEKLARVTDFANKNAGDEIGLLGATLSNLLEEIGSHQETLSIAGLVIEHSPNAIIVADDQERILQANPATTRIYGYSVAELIGQKLDIFRHPDRAADFHARIWNQVITVGRWRGETLDLRQDKEPIAMWHQMTALRDGSGRISHFIIISNDLSERKEVETRLHDLTYLDVLTGLPNRRMFLEQLGGVMNNARLEGRELALIVLNVDHFRTINESIGVDHGDELLQAIARRLSAEKDEGEMISHLSVDEFAVLLPGCGADQAARRAQQLLERLCGAYSLEMRSTAVTISLTVGISVFPHDADTGDVLLSQAATANRFAKYADGRGEFRFFTRDMNLRAHEHFVIDADLRKALADGGQFFLLYQPQVDLDDHQVVGVEALIRWKHPELGIISPAQFIPIAEESGLILEIGDWVLKEAVRQGAQWQRMGLNLRVAVNLSARQFKQADLPAQVKAVLDAEHLAPHLLELEITETSLMDNVEQATAHLESLSQLGVQIALDDFGTGYSSLSYVQRFVLHRLKIDQSFVRDLGVSGAIAIVNTIIDLARNLGLKVIAEGVETPEQLDYLVNMKCHEYQGYYCSRPIPATDILGIIASQRQAVAGNDDTWRDEISKRG
jgi:diguanylate cyclase (GGDEF)-like protein/PAS domain S-box-containing protein